MQREQFQQQTQNIDTFYQLSVRNAQNFTGTKKYPDVRTNRHLEHDKFSQPYGEFVCCFVLSTKDNTLQPKIAPKSSKTYKT